MVEPKANPTTSRREPTIMRWPDAPRRSPETIAADNRHRVAAEQQAMRPPPYNPYDEL